MPVTRSDKSATQLARLQADLPMIVAGNATRSIVSDAEWRTSGSWTSGSDDTEPGWPTRLLRDGHHHRWTRGSSAVATQYLIFDLDSVAFDVVALIGHNLNELEDAEITVQVADDSAFTSNLRTIAQWSTDLQRRLVSVTLGATLDSGASIDGNLYSGVDYLRIRFTTSLPSALYRQRLGELFLGTSYHLPYRCNAPGVDEDQFEGQADVYESEGGYRHLTQRYAGRYVLDQEWTVTDDDYADIFRDSFIASRYGRDPVLWIPRPYSQPRSTYVMRAPEPQAVVDEVDADERLGVLRMLEVAPYLEHESEPNLDVEETVNTQGVTATGSSGRLQAADHASLNTSTTAMTLSFWSYKSTNSVGPIISRWDASAQMWHFSFVTNGTTLRFNLGNGSGGDRGRWTTASGAAPLDQWNHIALVWNDPNAEIYVNGVSMGTTFGGAGTTMAMANSSLNLFRLRNGVNATLGLLLDELSIFIGHACTSGEVASLYGAGTPPNVVDLGISGLVSYYSFEGDYTDSVGVNHFTDVSTGVGIALTASNPGGTGGPA